MKSVNIHLPPKELKEFLEKNDDWVLSLDRDISVEEIQILFSNHIESEYYCDAIIGEIAGHLKTPLDILEVISEESDWRILSPLALNPNINEKIIDNIMRTKNYTVLEHLAYNPAMPKDKLKLLLNMTQDDDLREVIQNILSNK